MKIEAVIKITRYLSVDGLGEINIDDCEDMVDRVCGDAGWNPLDITAYMDIGDNNAISCTQDNVDFLYALTMFMQEHLDTTEKKPKVKPTTVKNRKK